MLTLAEWQQLEHKEQRAILEAWSVEEGEGETLAWEVAKALCGLLDDDAGEVRPQLAWGSWTLAFRTPLLFDRAALPSTAPLDSPVPCYLGFPLRPWIAREDWPLPELGHKDPLAHEQQLRRLLLERLEAFEARLGVRALSLDEALRRFLGAGFWIYR